MRRVFLHVLADDALHIINVRDTARVRLRAGGMYVHLFGGEIITVTKDESIEHILNAIANLTIDAVVRSSSKGT